LALSPDVQLLIVGEGSLRGSLEELSKLLGISGRVVFLGARRDIPELLASMDVFVLSSDLEGLPVALLEAMAAGRPVVATASGGIPSVIKDGVTGLLVKTGDEEGLASGIESVLKNSALSELLGENGRAFVRNNYGFESVINQYMRLYEE
jgi:glycosyltransferase involved in cell wall biosynthesis